MEWISVKDRLPEDGQLVIIYDPEAHPDFVVCECIYNFKHNAFYPKGSSGWFEADEIVGWQPIPQENNE